MKDWIECQSCQTEFKVVSIDDERINYCPYCGGVIDQEDEDDLIGYADEYDSE